MRINVEVSGATVFWSIPEVVVAEDVINGVYDERDLSIGQRTEQAWEAIVAHCAGYPSWNASCKAALEALFKANGRSLIRPLAGEGYGVVLESAQATSLSTVNTIAVTPTRTVYHDQKYAAYEDRIRQRIQRCMKEWRGGEVTRLLVGAINVLGGIVLRPSGGIYWLPERSIPQFERLSEILEQVNVKVYMMRTVAGHKDVAPIITALTVEVTDAINEIAVAQAGTTKMDARSIRSWKSKLEEKVNRLTEMEGDIGVRMISLSIALNTAMQAIDSARHVETVEAQDIAPDATNTSGQGLDGGDIDSGL